MKEMAEVPVRLPTRRGGPSDAARCERMSSVKAASSAARPPHLTRSLVVVIMSDSGSGSSACVDALKLK